MESLTAITAKIYHLKGATRHKITVELVVESYKMGFSVLDSLSFG